MISDPFITRTSRQDPHLLAHEIRGMLASVAHRARSEAPNASDPRAQALFETTAEVLRGLITAYEHFETQSEAVWGGDSPRLADDTEESINARTPDTRPCSAG